MEFFQEFEKPDLNVEHLQQLVSIKNLPELCASITNVLSENGNTGEIYSVWGQFFVSREEIINGTRFSLINCPHAFAWTVTFHEERNRIVIHCTIDKTEHEQDFIDSIEQFTKDWTTGLSKSL
jgi:hypothetical protein